MSFGPTFLPVLLDDFFVVAIIYFLKLLSNIIPENFGAFVQQQKNGSGIWRPLEKNCYTLNLWIAILAGFGGTLVMTCFTLIMSHILKKPFYVVVILATMLPFKKNVSAPNVLIYITATFIHYFIGVIFSYLYLWQLVEQLIINDVLSALLYGAIIGSTAVIGWRLFFFIHPNPPPIKLIPYLVTIWFGHITLSITLAAIFSISLPSTM